MAETSIEWTEKTWNPMVGCTVVSEGCRNCYAMRDAYRKAFNPNEKIKAAYSGLTRKTGRGRLIWTGQVRLMSERLEQPLRWRKPRRIFVNSMSDLFHESVPFEYIAAVFGVMGACPQHTHQVLTKRADRGAAFFAWLLSRTDRGPGQTRLSVPGVLLHYAQKLCDHPALRDVDRALAPWPLPNVDIGVSVEDQATADERIPQLLTLPNARPWVSYEPGLGPVDFHDWWFDNQRGYAGPGLDWVVVGGESGPGARPFDLAWARSTIEQCKAAGVPCFVKQIGADPINPGPGSWAPLRDRKGGDPSEWPADLRVREYPEVRRG